MKTFVPLVCLVVLFTIPSGKNVLNLDSISCLSYCAPILFNVEINEDFQNIIQSTLPGKFGTFISRFAMIS